MDQEPIPPSRQSDEKMPPEAHGGDSRTNVKLKTEIPEAKEGRIRALLEPVAEPTLETMLMLHSSSNPEMQLEYVEKLARFEPHQRQQVEEYVEKRRSDIWPLAEERLEHLYVLSQADTDASIEAFAEELRAMTPDQRTQFTHYRNERITEEAKGMAESSVAGIQTQATQSRVHDSKFVSMPGENTTATAQEMRQQAQTINQPNFMKDSPKPKWWQKILRRKNK